jgi:hypothetical protein
MVLRAAVPALVFGNALPLHASAPNAPFAA